MYHFTAGYQSAQRSPYQAAAYCACPAGVIEPLSLELDEESEDELESLAGMPLHPRAAGSGSGGPTSGGGLGSGALEDLRAQRFVLLRELWAAAPR